MSLLVLSTIAKSSFCSSVGTLNASSDFLKSAVIACHRVRVVELDRGN